MPIAPDELAGWATVAIITALPKERAAVKAMLDDVADYSTPGNAPGEYIVGTVPSKDGRRHSVVVALCSMGENLAAANTTILFERFPNLQFAIMTGIAGAVPDPSDADRDVRLGDIVVSSSHGVVQYDHDKEVLRTGAVISEPRHPPRPPSARLSQAHQELQELALEGKRPWVAHTTRASHLEGAQRPDPSSDVLHSAAAPSDIVERRARIDPARPQVFSGPIASGNKLLKNAKFRERLRATFGVLAVEMEASGVADATWLQRAGYFVVRGTCDYCDTFKNDDWQTHAAIVAAAYTRALLERTRAAGLDELADGPAHEAFEKIPAGLRASAAKNFAADEAFGDVVRAEVSGMLTAVAALNTGFDPAWPNPRPWSELVLEAIDQNQASSFLQVELTQAEWALTLALPPFISFLRRSWLTAQLDSNDANSSFFREMFASNPPVRLLNAELPDPAAKLVMTAALLRTSEAQRTRWTDDEIRLVCPDVRLARWMAADSFVTTLVRATAGSETDFARLPADGMFCFSEWNLPVRWKLLATVVSLAELKVPGLHRLPFDAIEHAAQLPDVARSFEEQFGRVKLTEDGSGNWAVRAVCDEPALDHALSELASQLDVELKSRRLRMSDYFQMVHRKSLPRVTASIEPTLIDGRPRYTTPHVALSLSGPHARRLFMGSDLWGDPGLAYRELFQNALDACRYRAARSQYLGLAYTPVVRIYHGETDAGVEYVECEDNGIGMDRNLIASCFATAGARFVETEECRREREQWDAAGIDCHVNSQFGIGVFSYFLAAEALTVETARLGMSGEPPDQRYLLQIPTASSLFRIVTLSHEEARREARKRASERGVEQCAAPDAGTRVRLSLKRREAPEHGIDVAETCVDVLRRNVWFSEVRLEVSDFRGNSFTIEPGRLAPWLPVADKAMVDGVDFWWLPDSGLPVASSAGKPQRIFRSGRFLQGNQSLAYHSYGRILVDGIVTDEATPGFIINLAGNDVPELSLDRRCIRGDISTQLERWVLKAVQHLPTRVSERFLTDLWEWDPRACHIASQRADLRWYKWNLFSPVRDEIQEEATHPYLPQLEGQSTLFRDQSGSDELIEIWKLARAQPARRLDPFLLEAHGVRPELAKNLRRFPEPIWNALRATELGVAEVVALRSGLGRREPWEVVARMSWLTGLPMSECVSRAAALANLMGKQWTSSAEKHVVVSDFDAWLLSAASIDGTWTPRVVDTLHVVSFCSRAGRDFSRAHDEYQELVARLGLHLDLDEALAIQVGRLSRDELHFAHALKSRFLYLSSAWVEDPDRRSTIERLVGVSGPSARPSVELPAKLSADDETRAIAHKLKFGVFRGELSLELAAGIARRLPMEFSVALGRVADVARACGVTVVYTSGQATAAAKFDDKDWVLLEGPFSSLTDRLSGPVSAVELASRLCGRRYLFRDLTAAEVHQRASRIYEAFELGAMPLDMAQVELILQTGDASYVRSRILEGAPSDGEFTVPGLLILAVKEDVSLNEVVNHIECLGPLGVTGPRASDSYLGVTWKEIIDADRGVSDN